ncbi:MAG: YcxB family protein [Adhaeribacter sp.]
MNLTPKQKRIIGILIISFFGILIVFMLLALIASVIQEEQSANVLSLGFMLFLLYLPLHYGVRLYKRGKSEGFTSQGPIVQGASVSLQVKINLWNYRALIYQITYSNLWIIYLTGLGIAGAFYSIIYPPEDFSFALIFPIFVLMVPVSVYFQTHKTYTSSKNLKEEMNFYIDAEHIRVSGESFSSSSSWKSLHKVKETKAWFLLYTSNMVAYIIPKESFKTAEDLSLFKRFIINTPDVLKDLQGPV